MLSLKSTLFVTLDWHQREDLAYCPRRAQRESDFSDTLVKAYKTKTTRELTQSA